jgi:peptidoglycan hydrolase-like protein with peptidoglycan-binding domain
MRKTLACLLAAVWLSVGVSAWSAQKKTASKPTSSAKKAPSKTTAAKSGSGTKAASSSKTKSSAKKGSAAKSSSKSKKSAGSRKSAPRTTWRNRQTAPTPERYTQIQQALADKGFLDGGAVTGSWGQSSVDALKKFQQAQGIPVTGKINAMSLIGLGLGPNHGAAGDQKPAAQPAEAQPAGPALPKSPEPR